MNTTSTTNAILDNLQAAANAGNFRAAEGYDIHNLRKVASSMGMKGASRLRKAELLDLFEARLRSDVAEVARIHAAFDADAEAKAKAKAEAEAEAEASEPAPAPKARKSRKATPVGTFVAPTTEVPKAERADKALEYLRANPGATAHQVAEALCLSTNYAPQMATAALTQLIRRGAATKATNEKGATVYSAL